MTCLSHCVHLSFLCLVLYPKSLIVHSSALIYRLLKKPPSWHVSIIITEYHSFLGLDSFWWWRIAFVVSWLSVWTGTCSYRKTPIGMTARMSLFHFLMLNCSYFESYHQSKLRNSIVCLQDAVAVMKVPKWYMLTATHYGNCYGLFFWKLVEDKNRRAKFCPSLKTDVLYGISMCS